MFHPNSACLISQTLHFCSFQHVLSRVKHKLVPHTHRQTFFLWLLAESLLALPLSTLFLLSLSHDQQLFLLLSYFNSLFFVLQGGESECAYVYLCVRVCTRMCTSGCERVICVYMYVCKHVHACASVYTYVYFRVRTCNMRVRACTCVRVCMRACESLYVCVCDQPE